MQIQKPLSRSLGLVFGGHIIAAGFGALSIFLASRKLSVGEFGLFSICLALIRTIPLFTNFGLDTTTMKFTSSFLRDGKKTEASQVVRALFSFRIATATALTLILFFSAEVLSKNVFRVPALTPLLRITAIGVFAATLFNYLKAVLWSHQLFQKSVLFQIIVDSGKFLMSGLLFILGALTPSAAVAIFGAGPLLGIFLGRSYVPGSFFSKEKFIPGLISQLFVFSRWIYLSDICRAGFAAVDFLLVIRMLGDRAAGIYGLADNLTYLFPVLLISLKAVLLPAVSRFDNKEQFEKYIKKSMRISLLATIGCLPLLLFSRPAILFFFGARYSEAVPIFNLLFLACLAGTIQTPLYAVVYALHKPFTLAMLEALKLILLAVGTYQGILVFGLLAPPVVLLAVNAASSCFLIYYTNHIVRRYKF
jgi:O-antigen/teichoic acid export membrane protein